MRELCAAAALRLKMATKTDDITDIIAELVFESDPELCSRFESQAQQLAASVCTDPVIGRWLDANDLAYLEAVFDLTNKDFAERFPTMKRTTRRERKELVETFREHIAKCPHCALKHKFDLELDDQIDQLLQENREPLQRMLEQAASSTQEGAGSDTTPRSVK